MKETLLENEFKVWIIKILTELGKILNLSTESFKKHLENIKKIERKK